MKRIATLGRFGGPSAIAGIGRLKEISAEVIGTPFLRPNALVLAESRLRGFVVKCQ